MAGAVLRQHVADANLVSLRRLDHRSELVEPLVLDAELLDEIDVVLTQRGKRASLNLQDGRGLPEHQAELDVKLLARGGIGNSKLGFGTR